MNNDSLNNNTFMDILGLPEWDDNIKNLLALIGEKRPKDNKNLGQVIITSDEFGISLVFSMVPSNEKQCLISESGSLFLNQISFDSTSPFNLPFDISYEDSAETISKKILLKNSPLAKYIVGSGVRYFMQNNEQTKFFLDLSFSSDTHEALDDFIIKSYDDSLDYSAYESYKVDLK